MKGADRGRNPPKRRRRPWSSAGFGEKYWNVASYPPCNPAIGQDLFCVGMKTTSSALLGLVAVPAQQRVSASLLVPGSVAGAPPKRTSSVGIDVSNRATKFSFRWFPACEWCWLPNHGTHDVGKPPHCGISIRPMSASGHSRPIDLPPEFAACPLHP